MPDTFASKNRIGRDRYWRLSGLCVLAAVAGLAGVVLTANATNSNPVNILAIVVAIAGAFLFVAACVALFVVGVWRLHDRNKTGFWIILYYPLPFVLALVAMDPNGKRDVLTYIALAILGWAIIDLGFRDGESAKPVVASTDG